MIALPNAEYLDLLNQAVAREIQVSAQYILQHTKMEKFRRRIIGENILLGDATTYDAFGAELKKAAIEEMKHIAQLVERIYVLGLGEATTKPSKIIVGDSMLEMAQLNVKAEEEALELYRKLVKKASSVGDWQTQQLVKKIYREEEEHLLKFQEYEAMMPEEDQPDPPKMKWQEIFTPEYEAMLNKALAGEFSAIIQYAIQHEKAAMKTLRQKKSPLEVVQGENFAEVVSGLMKKTMMEEMDHLEKISERMFEVDWEATPNVDPMPKIGGGPADWIALGREAEDITIVLYRQIIKKADELGDYTTRDLFSSIIQDEERHFWDFDDYA
jgi:bacterioferritin